MQDCMIRTHLIPVRDDEAESRRKAKSRQARQTRRATQGVTLSELMEAKKTYNPSNLDMRSDEVCGSTEEQCSQRRLHQDRRESLIHDQLSEERTSHEHLVEQGHQKRSSGDKCERSSLCMSSIRGAFGFTPSLILKESECTDENQNIVYGSWDSKREQHLMADVTSSLTETEMSSLYSRNKDLSSRPRKSLSDSPPSSPSTKTFRQDRVSRSDSSGIDSPSDRLTSRTYTRRENRLASLSKTEDDPANKDYKKMYEDALSENEKLKSRLDDSKQELSKIRSQLDRVTQKQDRISERSTVLESEKREKEVLEKKVSGMEEEFKVLTELKSDNQRLKDENGALIRVISKLSK